MAVRDLFSHEAGKPFHAETRRSRRLFAASSASPREKPFPRSLPHIPIDLILRGDRFIEGLVLYPGPGNVIKVSPLQADARAFRQSLDHNIIQTPARNTSAFAQRGVNGWRDTSNRVLHPCMIGT